MKIKISKKLIRPILLLTLSLTVFFVTPVFAQVDAWGGQAQNIQDGTGLSAVDPRVTVANIIRVGLGFLGIIALGLTLYAGFLWMTSSGDQDKVAKAKKILTSALIGLVIILSSFAIATFILNSLIGASNGGGNEFCTSGDSRSCGCGGSGVQSCNGGSWGACAGSLCGGGTSGSLKSCGTTIGACEATSTCDSLTEYCNESNCSCTLKSGLGASCNATSTPGICEASTDLCTMDLKCSATSCLCEGAPVIDWVSPKGGYCLNSINKACLGDSDCPGSQCEIDIPNGTVGNFVTIGGRYFGTSTGHVYFNGVEAKLASDATAGNVLCTDAWSDEKIIAIVPAGLSATSSIRIARPDAEEDTTNNLNRGPLIQDFLLNTIKRPGLCGLNPGKGVLGQSINTLGINLLGAKAFFGNYQSSVAGDVSIFTNQKIGTTTVPNIQSGTTTIFAKISSTTSNYYPFEDLENFKNLHYISSFDPLAGQPGQYVTIHGFGFGFADGNELGSTGRRHHVYFIKDISNVSVAQLLSSPSDGWPNIKEAYYTFPEICSDSLWGDRQIIVKVPWFIYNVEYTIAVYVDGWSTYIDSRNLPKTGNVSPQFTISTVAPLLPGVCALVPKMGMPTLTNVNVYGENFGSPYSPGWVHLSNDLIWSNWSYGVPNVADHASVVTLASTTSGLVSIKQGLNESNGLDFKIGSCIDAGATESLQNQACGAGSYCCPDNSTKAGRCEATKNDCFAGATTSVYEWDFNTGKSGSLDDENITTSTKESCAAYDLLQCTDSLFCPNSPGKCSSYPGASSTIDTKVSCASINSAGLEYKPKPLNRYASSTQSCDLSTTTQDVLGKDVLVVCAISDGTTTPHLQYDSKSSCKSGWTMALGGKCEYLADTCDLCGDGFKCFNNAGTGACVLDKTVCPDKSSCVAEKCVKDDQPSCDCCCEIGKSPQDCCAGLTCEGSCGAGTNSAGKSLGECGGCTQYNADKSVNQTASNNACNCTGTTGKFCETGDGKYPQGVCRDCATLGTDACTDKGVMSCCVDGKNGNQCTGGGGDKSIVNGDAPDLAYCAYYNCANDGMSCNLSASTTGKYADLAMCGSECRPTLAGMKCSEVVVNALKCSYDFCKDLYCLDSSGKELAGCDANGNNCTSCDDGSCGACCCDAKKLGKDASNLATYDKCNKINPMLACRADVGPNCGGPDRGLCCGCSADSDCGGVTMGCSDDTCCRARPTVESTMPGDNSESVCRNAKISATFSEKMDINSFSNNVIVVGSYGQSQCPDGTQYLTQNGSSEEKGIFAKIYYKFIAIIEPILPEFIANAFTVPIATNNYCAVQGTVSGYIDASEKAVLEFQPTKLFDADKLYYVIIKGDEVVVPDTVIDSKKGVKSQWGVSLYNMSGTGEKIFNAVSYPNAKVFSFKTLASDGGSNGACAVDSVKIEPTSYLFQTNVNDENDDSLAGNFDNIKDSDKVFVANAYSADGQELFGVANQYDWNWSWQAPDAGVASNVVVGGLPVNESLIRAKNDVTDGRTNTKAIIRITDDTIFNPTTLTKTKEGTADIYVFVCSNPWPAVASNGTWAPWTDKTQNCQDPNNTSEACSNTNFELYYCRDAGGPGTFDDLPAAANSNAEVVKGSPLTSGDLLKEVYFFGGNKTDVAGSAVDSVIATNTPTANDGGSATVSWTALSGSAKYKIYWGTSKGQYSSSVLVNAPSASTTINNLQNEKTYYFNVASVSSGGVESKLFNSNDAVLLVKDVVLVSGPTVLSAQRFCNGDVEFSWIPTLDPTVKGYNFLYKVSSASSWGSAENVGNVQKFIKKGLSKDLNYTFSLRSYDEKGIEGGSVTTQISSDKDADHDGVSDLCDSCYIYKGKCVKLSVTQGTWSSDLYPHMASDASAYFYGYNAFATNDIHRITTYPIGKKLRSNIFSYINTTNQMLSIGFLHNYINASVLGSAWFDFSGDAWSSATISIADESNEFSKTNQGRWGWDKKWTDGGMLDINKSLDTSWSLTITPLDFKGINEWMVKNPGDVEVGSYIPSMTQPVIIKYVPN